MINGALPFDIRQLGTTGAALNGAKHPLECLAFGVVMFVIFGVLVLINRNDVKDI